MKRIARGWFVGLITFVIGFSFAYTPVIKTSLEEISAKIEAYEGRLVEVETYAAFDDVLDWRYGEPFEKAERWTSVELVDESFQLAQLKGQLTKDWSDKSHNRVKVRVRGLLEDNCNDGTTCCFGESMSLKNATLTVVGPVTPYSRRELE